MKPKVEAAAAFVRRGGRRAIIARLSQGPAALRGETGTTIMSGIVNLHEYQARTLLKAAGIPMLDGDVASTPTEAEAIARRLGGTVVIKAQVHAGGRGKAGGVKLARNAGEAPTTPRRFWAWRSRVSPSRRCWSCRPPTSPARATSASSWTGRRQRPVFMVSSAGGVDIEEVAAKTPEKIVRLPVDPTYGLLPHQALALGFVLYRDFNQVKAAARIMEQLYSRLHGQRLLAGRDQSAGHHTGTARCWRSTPRS